MSKLVVALVGIAAAIYIGQSAWALKTSADAADQARADRLNKIIERTIGK